MAPSQSNATDLETHVKATIWGIPKAFCSDRWNLKEPLKKQRMKPYIMKLKSVYLFEEWAVRYTTESYIA